MQRGRGKVPTNKNKEMVGGANQNTPPKKDWGAFTKRMEERRLAGKSTPTPPAKTSKENIKEIIKNKNRGKDR